MAVLKKMLREVCKHAYLPFLCKISRCVIVPLDNATGKLGYFILGDWYQIHPELQGYLPNRLMFANAVLPNKLQLLEGDKAIFKEGKPKLSAFFGHLRVLVTHKYLLEYSGLSH